MLDRGWAPEAARNRGVALRAWRCPECGRLRPEKRPHDSYTDGKRCAWHGRDHMPYCVEVRLIPEDEMPRPSITRGDVHFAADTLRQDADQLESQARGTHPDTLRRVADSLEGMVDALIAHDAAEQATQAALKALG